MAPATPFAHMLRMTDGNGIFEHASGIVPRIEHGYCLDDAARALIVACRQRPVRADVDRLIEIYFRFVIRAQAVDGTCHNRLDRYGRWEDDPGTGDWWGRALWALGTTAARCTRPSIRSAARIRFEHSAVQRSRHPRSMAFAALGAAEMLTVHPGHGPSRDILSATAAMIGHPPIGAAWPWPEPRLTYANAAIPEALIAAGWALGDDAVLTDGLDLLRWLLDIDTFQGHLSVTPSTGWAPPLPRPAFDQQPIEVAALADACSRALRITGDRQWSAGLDRAVGWFLGDNDCHTPLYDESTGGGFDALTPGGVNINQGAESTLAMMSTMQHAHRLPLVLA